NAKAEIFENIKPEGVVILNADNEYFSILEKKAKENKKKIISVVKNSVL
ncbi:MAG: hypothetical protein HN931_03060, partial [Desulfobacterales bacterium]|nr:hypothetical protein [Desulfobacterales bacterium]